MKALHVFLGAVAIVAVDVAAYRYFKRHFVPGPATPIEMQPEASTVFRHDPAPSTPAPGPEVVPLKQTELWSSGDRAKGFKCAGGLLYQTSENDGVKTITLHSVRGKPSRCN